MIFSYGMYNHIFKCLYDFHLLNAPLLENLLKKAFKYSQLKIFRSESDKKKTG